MGWTWLQYSQTWCESGVGRKAAVICFFFWLFVFVGIVAAAHCVLHIDLASVFTLDTLSSRLSGVRVAAAMGRVGLSVPLRDTLAHEWGWGLTEINYIKLLKFALQLWCLSPPMHSNQSIERERKKIRSLFIFKCSYCGKCYGCNLYPSCP